MRESDASPHRNWFAAAIAGARDAARGDSTCAACALFIDDPQALEQLLSGIGAFSSAYGSTRGRAGICMVDARFHDPAPACSEFLRRVDRKGP